MNHVPKTVGNVLMKTQIVALYVTKVIWIMVVSVNNAKGQNVIIVQLVYKIVYNVHKIIT